MVLVWAPLRKTIITSPLQSSFIHTRIRGRKTSSAPEGEEEQIEIVKERKGGTIRGTAQFVVVVKKIIYKSQKEVKIVPRWCKKSTQTNFRRVSFCLENVF